LPANITSDSLAIRQSISQTMAEGFERMYDNEDLIFELSELVNIHRLETNSDLSFASFTLREVFSYKDEKESDFSTYSLISKKIDST
tara:strand:- start:971 stop:1231 length:261 start_codon:yes stop_codon:yes gene_type:complete